MRHRTIILGIALACSACHSYVQVPIAQLTVGKDVRLDLTADGRTQVVSSVGPNAVTLSGVILSRDGTSLTLAVREVDRLMAGTDLLRGERIRIPADAVATAQYKKFSRVRSVVFGSVLVAGGALIANSLGGGSNERGNGNPPPSNPQ